MLSNASRFAIGAVLLAGGIGAVAADAQQYGAGYPRPGTQAPAPAQQNYPQQDAGGPPPAEGPQGSSRVQPGEERYDQVGYAGVRPIPETPGTDAVAAAVRGLAPGNFAEVTSLDSGRTILVLVAGQAGSALTDLSPAAARQLGLSGASAAVRVRKVNPSGPDQAALRQGRPAGERLDAPPALLTGLRHRLAPPVVAAPAPSAPPPPRVVTSVPPRPISAPPRPASAPPRPAATTASGANYPRPTVPPPAPAAHGRFYVQVAALSNAERARTLAGSLGGLVRQQGNLYRVQLGPFADTNSANRARAQVAARGYGDARIVTQ